MTTENGKTNKPQASWYGFLVACFAVAAGVGVFATYGAQLPFQRGLATLAVLERADVIGDQPEQLAPLREALGEEAALVLDGKAPFAVRVSQARAEILTRTREDGADIGRRMRVVIAGYTAAAALFGCILLGGAARQQGR